MRFLIVALFMVLASGVSGQEAEQQPSPPDIQAETDADTNGGSDGIAPRIVPDVAEPDSQTSGEETGQANPENQSGNAPRSWEWILLGDNPAQATMAWASLLAAFAALVAAILLWRTLRETRRSDERQTRAYVGPEDVSIKYDPDIGCFHLHMIVKNSGQTPAFDLCHRSEWADSLGELANPVIEPGSSKGTIWPAGTVHIQTSTIDTPEEGRFLTPERCKEIYRGNATLWLNGHVEYRDAFGKPRFTNFRYRSYRRGRRFSLSVADEGNEAN